MAEVTLTLDADLIDRARGTGGELAAVVEAALRHYLDAIEQDRRWAEDNALLVEALADGVPEVRP